MIKHGYTVLNLCYFSLKKEGEEREAPTRWGLFRILLIRGVVVKGEAYSRRGGGVANSQIYGKRRSCTFVTLIDQKWPLGIS